LLLSSTDDHQKGHDNASPKLHKKGAAHELTVRNFRHRFLPQDGEGEVVVEAVARDGTAERRARAAIQAREVPRPGGLLGQGTRAVFLLSLLLLFKL
jgi:hypothetical protein